MDLKNQANRSIFPLFTRMSLRGKILLFLVIINSITIITMTLLTYNNYYDSESKSMDKMANNLNQQVVQSIDMLFSRMDEISMSIYADIALNSDISLLKSYIGRKDTVSEYEFLSLELRIIDRLKQYMATAKNISTGRLYIDGYSVYVNPPIGNITRSSDSFLNNGYLPEVLAAKGRYVISPPFTQTISTMNQEAVLVSLSRVISDISIKDNKVDIAVLSLDMHTDYFNQYFTESKLSPNSIIRIIDSRGNIISSTQNSDQAAQEVDPDQFFIYTLEHPRTGYTVSTWVPITDLVEFIRPTLFSIILLAVLFFFIGTLISIIVSRTITRPLQKLLSTMQTIGKGNLTARTPVLEQRELKIITEQFNSMLDNIQHLIHENYLIKLKRKEAELIALQMQINPHFLYNTLDTINWRIRSLSSESDKDLMASMLHALVSILRYSVKNTDKEVPLYEEISQVQNYLFIQSVRFEGRFTVQMVIDEATENVPVQKLLLQPLVENSILHGLENKESGGIIVIRSYLKDHCLHLFVYDNGSGMPHNFDQTQLDTMFANTKSSSIGLRNVNERLILRYGKENGLQIQSKKGKYTKVRITIPLEGQNDV